MNTTLGLVARPANAGTVLLISPCEEDRTRLVHIFSHSNWKLRSARTCSQGMASIWGAGTGVVICERDLPDGSWRDVLDQAAAVPRPPLVIVSSRLADDLLWAEVLNVGGYDVLLKPFDQNEVIWAVGHAWRQWSAPSQRTAASAFDLGKTWRGAEF